MYVQNLGSFFRTENFGSVDWQGASPPVDLYWFFEISIKTEKKLQLELKKKIS